MKSPRSSPARHRRAPVPGSALCRVALAATAFAAIAGPAHAAQTCFFENYNYQGASWCTDAGAGEIVDPVVDKVSSVSVPAGYKVDLYQHPDYAGSMLELQASAPNLNDLGFNNLTSSFKVLPLVASAQVCFYESYNFLGASWCSDAGRGDIAGGVVGKVSSVKVPAGYTVDVYQQAGLAGNWLELLNDTPNLSNLGFNNLAASFRSTSNAVQPPARQILFIGNSFTHGGFDPAMHYNATNVSDLDATGYGGVPGIFKQLTVEAGLNYTVAIEAVSGQTLQYHDQNKLPQIGAKRWDVVVMQDYSTLDPNDPGNPANLVTYSKLIEQYVHGAGNPNANPAALVYLLATWARADELYATPGGHWYGDTVEQMDADLAAAYAQAAANDAAITGVLPVGDGFELAIEDDIADRNPYDGIDAKKVNEWNTDGHHASAWGSYLESLIVFGRITGVDPRTLGKHCAAAQGLGLTPHDAVRAQKTAYKELKAAGR